MMRWHKELYHRLEDLEKLRLYAQLIASKHQALEEGLGKERSKVENWERKAKEGTKRATRVEKERDEAKEEAKVTRLAAIIAGDAKARVEGDLVKVQEALAATEEARRRVEAKTA